MTPRHPAPALGTELPSHLPTPGRDRLGPVPRRVEVHRTFADHEGTRSSGPVWRRTTRRVPTGLVHAADLLGDASLCGLPLDALHEFGRSRFPFERFEETVRCQACHVAAGRPTA